MLTVFVLFFLHSLDRSEEKIAIIEGYLKATKQLRNYSDASQDPHYTKVSAQLMSVLLVDDSSEFLQTLTQTSFINYCLKPSYIRIFSLSAKPYETRPLNVYK